MPVTIPELNWISMTATVNGILPSSNFLRQLLFPPSSEEQLTTETLEYGMLTSDRAMAPMVKKNGKSVMVGGIGEAFTAITMPNIRVSRPMDAAQTYFKRHVGTTVFPTPGEMTTAIQQAVARDLAYLATLIENREEWMAAMAIRGTISYEVTDQESFTVSYPRDAGNVITLTGTDVWSDAASNPETDFLDAQLAASELTGLVPTDAIMSRSAYDAFRNNAKVISKLDNRRIDLGNLTASVIQASGAIYGGIFANTRIWCYPRALTDNGVSVPLIRDKYVEFVTPVPQAENRLYYGAIPDFEAAKQGTIAVKRFSKSWEEQDPSVLMSLVHTRPLAVTRRPNTMVSMKVLA